MRRSTTVALGLAALSVILSGSTRATADEPKPLPRSFYVPIEFHLCEHLVQAVLSEEGQPVSALPAKRVFQFTYYPELDRGLPELVKIRIDGHYVHDDEPFVAKLAVTPDGLHTAKEHVAFDTQKDELRFRSRIDVRHETMRFNVHCPRYCSRNAAPAVAASSEEAPKKSMN
jgi:hypothetical protein